MEKLKEYFRRRFNTTSSYALDIASTLTTNEIIECLLRGQSGLLQEAVITTINNGQPCRSGHEEGSDADQENDVIERFLNSNPTTEEASLLLLAEFFEKYLKNNESAVRFSKTNDEINPENASADESNSETETLTGEEVFHLLLSVFFEEYLKNNNKDLSDFIDLQAEASTSRSSDLFGRSENFVENVVNSYKSKTKQETIRKNSKRRREKNCSNLEMSTGHSSKPSCSSFGSTNHQKARSILKNSPKQSADEDNANRKVHIIRKNPSKLSKIGGQRFNLSDSTNVNRNVLLGTTDVESTVSTSKFDSKHARMSCTNSKKDISSNGYDDDEQQNSASMFDAYLPPFNFNVFTTEQNRPQESGVDKDMGSNESSDENMLQMVPNLRSRERHNTSVSDVCPDEQILQKIRPSFRSIYSCDPSDSNDSSLITLQDKSHQPSSKGYGIEEYWESNELSDESMLQAVPNLRSHRNQYKEESGNDEYEICRNIKDDDTYMSFSTFIRNRGETKPHRSSDTEDISYQKSFLTEKSFGKRSETGQSDGGFIQFPQNIDQHKSSLNEELFTSNISPVTSVESMENGGEEQVHDKVFKSPQININDFFVGRRIVRFRSRLSLVSYESKATTAEKDFSPPSRSNLNGQNNWSQVWKPRQVTFADSLEIATSSRHEVISSRENTMENLEHSTMKRCILLCNAFNRFMKKVVREEIAESHLHLSKAQSKILSHFTKFLKEQISREIIMNDFNNYHAIAVIIKRFSKGKLSSRKFCGSLTFSLYLWICDVAMQIDTEKY